MNRLTATTAALAMALALAAGAAFADYKTCMHCCMVKHSFFHCKAECSAKEPAKSCMSTYDEKVDLIFSFIDTYFGATETLSAIPLDQNDSNLLEISFTLYDASSHSYRNCGGVVRILGDCRTVGDRQSNDLSDSHFRWKAVQCE